MIIVQETFVCKPGNASKMAKMFKEMMSITGMEGEVMTDMTGQYNRVVMVSKHESMAAFEESFNKYSNDPEMQKKMGDSMKGYHEMFLTGSREIFKTW